MTLAFFGMQALLAFDRIHWDRRRDLLPWFFAAFLLAFLAKATAAILVIGLPIAVRLSLDRAWRRVLRRDVLAWALACCAACLAWYAALLLWVPGAAAVLRESLLLPLGLAPPTDSAAHVRPVWYYVPGLLAAGAPAALLAPLAAWHVAARRDPTRARAGFPALAFATLFVALSAMPMKQKHYLMPLLPLLALSIAPAVRAAHERHRHACERTVAALGWGLLVIALPAALLPALHLAIAGEGAVAAVLVGGGVLGACAIGFASARRGSLRAFGLSVTMLTLTLVGVHLASFDPLRTSFRESVAPESIDFDAQRWSLVFARHPALRAFYHAEDWAGG